MVTDDAFNPMKSFHCGGREILSQREAIEIRARYNLIVEFNLIRLDICSNSWRSYKTLLGRVNTPIKIRQKWNA